MIQQKTFLILKKIYFNFQFIFFFPFLLKFIPRQEFKTEGGEGC